MKTKRMKLTALERRVLRVAFKSAYGNGHDFGFVEDVVAGMKPLKPQAVGAVLTSLSKKNVLQVHDPVTTNAGTRDQHTYTQFTWLINVDQVEQHMKEPTDLRKASSVRGFVEGTR